MLLALLATVTLAAPTDSGEAWIRKVHAAHHEGWFRTMTFIQKTTYPGRPDETWYETMATPGKLRIDVAGPAGIARSIIFRNDSVYSQAGTTVQGGRPMVHTMLVILHNIHVLDPAKTAAALRANGYDLSRTHQATWQGRPVMVIGAAAGDTVSNQFWLDTETLLPLRMIEKTGNGGRMDAHVGKHRAEGRAWVEREILIYVNGTMVQGEEYTWVATDVPLDAQTFEPGSAPPAWVMQRVKGGG